MENGATTNRLYRSREQKAIAGVAGGLAQYFNVDVTLVRLALVAGLLIPPTSGIVFLGYIILAFVVPQRPLGEAEPVVMASSIDASRAREIGGFVLLGLGLLFLAGNMGLNHLFDWFSWRLFWPLVLVGVGALLLLRRRD